jgi:hypothetical protein
VETGRKVGTPYDRTAHTNANSKLHFILHSHPYGSDVFGCICANNYNDLSLSCYNFIRLPKIPCKVRFYTLVDYNIVTRVQPSSEGVCRTEYDIGSRRVSEETSLLTESVEKG